ncbi:hypothetical protein [Paraburkholderia sp. J8-2]|uniref:hypothetical protein n=1 Tax=Paraburkholderia sp. J8-2 TaxID=2805440 RepID=UPI002AB757D0|nr:hypothetical protein [Paraburkholderia sp. J8-2]
MNQQSNKQFRAPVIAGQFFPYRVTVKAVDACFPQPFEASGLMYENGLVLVDYPFVKPGQTKDEAEVDAKARGASSQIDLTSVVLPNGNELPWGDECGEAERAPALAARVKAAIAAYGDAEFACGEYDSAHDTEEDWDVLHAECKQAEANLQRLLGLDENVIDAGVIKVAVLCDNAQGERELRTYAMRHDNVDGAEGEHYEVALACAVDEGYGGTMVAFDEHDPAARHLFATAAWFGSARA